jgi:hypothetical protein
MTRRNTRAAASALALGVAGLLAASCSSPSRPPTESSPLPTPTAMNEGGPDSPTGGMSQDAASSSSGGDAGREASARDASPVGDGTAGDATSNDAPGPDGAPVDAPADSTVPIDAGDAAALPPLCAPGTRWVSQGRVASIPSTTFGRFGGISSDEQAVAWTSTTGTIYVADRANRVVDFGAAAVVGTGTIAVANDRVAMSPTGLKIVAVLADQSGFAAFNRTVVGGAWTSSAPQQFASVDAMATTDGGGKFSAPVLGADDDSFYYSLAPPGGTATLYESTWDAAAHEWTTGVALPNQEFSPTATARRRATGASSDGRTLFFYDETVPTQRAAWRDAVGAPFTQFADLPGLAEAAPNHLCDTLYFQGADSVGPGLFVAFPGD